MWRDGRGNGHAEDDDRKRGEEVDIKRSEKGGKVGE